MSPERTKRKLTAIFSADVKGYSRLMEDDEEATVATLTSCREVITKVVGKHSGRVVDSPGDNLLAEFASVVDAMRGAVEIQEELRARNSELPDHRRMEFRIGINLGDVIEEDGRLYGDGVNIAARVEGLADGGGICLSEGAYQQVKNKLSLGIEYLGEHKVKNISEPVPVYRLVMEGGAAGVQARRPAKPKVIPWQKWAVPAIVVVAAVALWQFSLRPKPPSVEPASVERMALPLPDKLSIAVLPFDNLTNDPEQEYFSDGITENIITELTRFPDLFVIARNSTFAYKGESTGIQQIGRELGVRYVLEGSVQKSDGRVRIAAQLIDASTGGHVWAESYDRDGEDIFVLQDEITQQIVAALGSSHGEIEQAARKQVLGRDPTNLTAFELSLRAAEHFHRFTKKDNAMARELNRRAMELKPGWARRYAGEGWMHLADYGFGWSDSPLDSLEQAYEWGKKALELDPNDYESHWLMAYVYLHRKQHDQALASAERALELNPNSAGLLQTIGGAIYPYIGKGARGVELVKKAMRLDPRHVELWYFDLARAHYQARQYGEAVQALRQISRLELPYRLYLCASLAQSGRTEEARTQVGEILKLKPGTSIEFWGEREPYRDAVDKEHWIDGLRKAGLPE